MIVIMINQTAIFMLERPNSMRTSVLVYHTIITCNCLQFHRFGWEDKVIVILSSGLFFAEYKTGLKRVAKKNSSN